MKKVINEPDNVVLEMIEGFLETHPDKYKIASKNGYGLMRQKQTENKVSIIIGGGSGHEPMFLGYLGEGMADAVAIGHIFAAPNSTTVYETAKSAASNSGVLFIYGNYAGDVLNFDMGSELLEIEGIKTETVKVTDDIASASKDCKLDRRGIAGDLFVIKIAGAAAQLGYDLQECKRVSEKANHNLRSIGIGLTPGTNPMNGNPNFELPDDEVEFGIGIHGEPGILRTSMETADELTDKMAALLFEDIDLHVGDSVVVCINGLGSTTLMELYIVNRRFQMLLKERGVDVYDTQVGNFCTTQEMGGFSISVMLLDKELKELYDVPARTPFFVKGK